MKSRTHMFGGSSLLKFASWMKEPEDGSGIDPDLFPVLVIQFNAPALYHYYRVPESRYNELIAAPSAGQFYNQNIKGVFGSKKVL